MDILKNLKNILKVSFTLVFMVVLSTFATEVASAKTINSSNFVDESIKDYFDNVYLNSDYSYIVYSNEYLNSGSYNYSSNYYICLSDTKPEVTDDINVNASCDELYRYYRNDNSSYTFEKVNDDKLIVNNGVYYYYSNKNIIDILLFIICLFLGIYLIWELLVSIF